MAKAACSSSARSPRGQLVPSSGTGATGCVPSATHRARSWTLTEILSAGNRSSRSAAARSSSSLPSKRSTPRSRPSLMRTGSYSGPSGRTRPCRRQVRPCSGERAATGGSRHLRLRRRQARGLAATIIGATPRTSTACREATASAGALIGRPSTSKLGRAGPALAVRRRRRISDIQALGTIASAGSPTLPATSRKSTWHWTTASHAACPA
mmetsp:Transcript_58506/g.150609  ORF Transcript_58506/g.150609 Transcript_58506/m.150609 type:complete len:210 (+) Transcript_58506:340-969(+)